MADKRKFLQLVIGLSILVLVVPACGYRLVPVEMLPGEGWGNGRGPRMGMGGTVWLPGSFETNGEQIFFTGVNEDGERIAYTGGPDTGMMMDDYLSCASCHGVDGKGGEHYMHMELMDAPDIRWESLLHETEEHDEGEDIGEFDLDTFKMAVVGGKHPDGDTLSSDMPRWELSDEDLLDLSEYLKSLP